MSGMSALHRRDNEIEEQFKSLAIAKADASIDMGNAFYGDEKCCSQFR